MTVLFAVLGVLVVLGLYAGHALSNHVVKPRHFDYEQGAAHERTYFHWVEGEFDAQENELFSLTSYDGTRLSCMWLPCAQKSNKAVVIAHGHGCCAINSYKYAKPFLKRGYNALLFDFRNSGKSGGHITTLGFKEKFDLKTAIDEAFLRLGEDAIVGTHGESMGAATVLLEACMDERLAFAVADCPFFDMQEQTAYNLKKDYNLPRFPFLILGAFSYFVRTGGRMKDISPLHAIEEKEGLLKLPVLFIHGTADTYIPPEASKRLYEAKHGKKWLWFCEGAKHARSIAVDPVAYDTEIGAFLEENEL